MKKWELEAFAHLGRKITSVGRAGGFDDNGLCYMVFSDGTKEESEVDFPSIRGLEELNVDIVLEKHGMKRIEPAPDSGYPSE
jgi:hypothetical protein